MTEKTRYQMARKATLISATTNSSLALIKIIIGYLAHSQALMADGVHSLSDLITDALVLIASKAGGRIPDADHPYGHQRIETIITIVIGFILMIVGISIAWDAVQHIQGKPHQPPEMAALITALVSILIYELLYRYISSVGKKIHSTLLISNAWHNRSDAFVSIIVAVSIIGSQLGWHYLDFFAAFVIALLIFKISLQMIWSAIKELIDTGVDEKTQLSINNCIQNISGVVAIHQLRTRLHGGNIFVDVHIIVDPFISVSEGHHIGEQVHLALLNQFKNISDVTVHVDPEDDESSRPSLNLPSREETKAKLADIWGKLLGYAEINKMTLHYLNGRLYVEIFMPVTVARGRKKKLLRLYQQAAQKIPEIADVKIYFW